MDPTVAKRYETLCSELRSRIESQAFLERHRQGAKDFTRKRQLTFRMLIFTLINMLKRALQDELDEMFRLFSKAEVAERCVTKSAFSQARQKLKHTAFIELNQLQVAHFYSHFAAERWLGYRLLGIDGSMLDLPTNAATLEAFGSWGSRHGTQTAKARVSQLFDVLNQLTVDGLIAAKAAGERLLAQQHLAHVHPGDLLLLDRGYPAFWLFLAILARGADFCARLEVHKWLAAQALIASGAREQVVTLSLCATSRALCQSYGFPATTLTLRLIRVDLPSGEVEVLATSLFDTDRFPTACFAALYQQRWPVEEDYKQLKARLELENWSGLSPQAIRQDFYAALFTKNLAAILAQPAQHVVAAQTATHKHTYRINMTNLLSKLKDTIVLLFSHNHLLQLFDALWQQMLCTIEPVRKNRSVPRKKPVRRSRFPASYKPTR